MVRTFGRLGAAAVVFALTNFVLRMGRTFGGWEPPQLRLPWLTSYCGWEGRSVGWEPPQLRLPWLTSYCGWEGRSAAGSRRSCARAHFCAFFGAVVCASCLHVFALCFHIHLCSIRVDNERKMREETGGGEPRMMRKAGVRGCGRIWRSAPAAPHARERYCAGNV